MIIAVLSGKGGAGKTMVSVNLAEAMGRQKPVTYLDCDVEEPNGHLFLKPENVRSTIVSVPVPVVDVGICNGCRVCVDFCRFNALAFVGGQVRVFEEVCHACGGCMRFCPQGAISERQKPIGRIETGYASQVRAITGIMDVGEVSGVPIIKEMMARIHGETDGGTHGGTHDETQVHVVDCPPGSACIVMESIKDADYCVLVAEPTLFGVHNLDMVRELVTLFEKPFGVVLNKCDGNGNPAESYCVEKGIRIIGRIPFDIGIGEMNSNGRVIVRESNHYMELFQGIAADIEAQVHHAGSPSTEGGMS